MVAIAGLGLAVVALFIIMLAEGGPDSMREDEAARRLTGTSGNVTPLRQPQEDDPLLGCCGRCGRYWSQHPGGFCPDGVGADGLVSVNAPVFVPADEGAE